jgi:hypothetical protein
MTPDSTRDIDTAIDEAARGLTASEPFRPIAARVATRLDARPRGRRWRAPVLIASSATAVIALAVSLAPQRAVPPIERSTRLVATTTAPPARAIASAIDAAPTTPTPAPRASTRRPVPRPEPLTPSFDAVDAAWRARTVPALPLPAPLVVETSQPDPLSTPLLELKPIAAAPLELPALAYGASQR